MQTKWEVATPADQNYVQNLAEQLSIPEHIAQVLINRDIGTPETARLFFGGKTEDLYDPFLLADMDAAVDRVVKALQKQEKIIIHGDYDVDGITSVSMLYLFLRDLGGQVSYYIPDRQQEGYGLSMGGIEESKRRGVSLMISVDCGITSVSEVELAKKFGIDTIISDHHEPGPSLPEAVAVLDPKRADCSYPFSELAGVGVAYKLAQGVLRRMNLEGTYLERYLDLVAIGSAADIVPLVDENRILVKEGLERLNRNGNEGLKALIDTANFKRGNIQVGNIVFGLAPRINAVGRLGSAERAVRLLITRDYNRALNIASVLEKENRKRKEIDNHTLNEALEKIAEEYNPDRDSVIVLSREAWHPGVIGIVASRIVEKYYRPTVMITIDDGIGKGSARSIPGFDLFSAIRECSDLLEQYGGHKYAAGLTIREDRIEEFRERFNRVSAEMISPEDLIPKLGIDAEIDLDEISPEIVKTLRDFAPFGPKNMKPNFASYDLDIVGVPRIVGANHLKFKVKQPSSGGLVFDVIGFNLGHLLPVAQHGHGVDMVYNIEENEWMNQVNLQLCAKDIR
ncbi:single-stranded-DNA-specific exonuclease RecJ [candidate division LCP-89 bacterium B3_LCP]|uniref:Single-stranded-DNA-specific exonuclease RecJ n=1 Tax=candidate division LCP-89 bacterium B3_LCP TaxID=2012998 RepID=A0A532V3C8_UNCL8|nr:MAG: single-stranded-DNA-specific exonuclease RecJ [candidate division LCP-89 bacterium B3_LCP]